MRSRPWSRVLPALPGWTAWLSVLGLLVAVALALMPGASADEQDADAGREVYAASCAMCHGTDATGMMGMHPALRGAVPRLSAEGVEVTIRNGRQTTPPMPAFADRLSDDEIADVIAYLGTLPTGPRNFGPEMDRDDSREEGMMRDGGMMDRMTGGAWMGPLLGVLVILVLLALGVLVVVLVNQRGTQARDQGQRGGESPREILDRRYAAGELSPEEYRQARDDLDG